MAKLTDFNHDPKNANKGTIRGQKQIVSSIQSSGVGRSIVTDKNGVVIGGNKSLEAMAEVLGVDVEPIVIKSKGDRPVIHIREDLDLDDPDPNNPARKLAYNDNVTSWLSFDLDSAMVMADIEEGFNFDDIGVSLAELGEMGIGELLRDDKKRSGGLYNAGEGHDIEPFKLAYRIEAIWRMPGNLAIDLFSGQGQLAAWYKRRFQRVVTVDKAFQVGDVDYSMSAIEFIRTELPNYLDFDFIDFDDEGTPASEIQELFKVIAGKKKNSFILALTDGNGLNLKYRGMFDFGKYLTGEGKRKATQKDYDCLEEMITNFVAKCAEGANFTPAMLSSYRGREGNVVYQTWLINYVEAGISGSGNQPGGKVANLS